MGDCSQGIFCSSSLIIKYYIYRTPEQCAQQPSARRNCGYPYISAETCNNRGCCFDDSIVGAIWCFFPRTEEGNRVMGLFFPVPEYTENITVVLISSV
uniref:P-type domain-containing protein n=1 Tax=Terrapene triunguis TaxID=2587831 RepID=A0A674JL84_9SAUR